MKELALNLINLYQGSISPLSGPSCRYSPTCSHYGYEAINKYGVWKGSWLTARRLGRCHPFVKGGLDPVK